MNIPGTLFTKILIWFFLNLALIGVLVWGVQALQLDPGAASTKQDEFRVQAAARALHGYAWLEGRCVITHAIVLIESELR